MKANLPIYINFFFLLLFLSTPLSFGQVRNLWSRLFKSPLFFLLVGYAIFKDFSYLFGAKFTGQKFYRWRHDNWPIGQWVIFHAAPDKAYVNHFFPAWIYNMTQIHSGETSWPRDCVARFDHFSRTYVRSTCSKPTGGGTKQSFLRGGSAPSSNLLPFLT